MILFLILLKFISQSEAKVAAKECGGTFTDARGILQTPNFPGPFNVPLNCEWIIDAQHIASPNTSIVVYLTQLFVFEGLTFTEYQHYGSDYKIHPRVIHEVNETNINKLKWVQTFQNFLVIQLKLPSAESAHLRVLDRFLDVFGFNITYEITDGNVRQNSCTMMDCGFTGICYDYYTKFVCDCFEGYTGPHCSDGPKSYCSSNGSPICKNGGTCIHVGISAVRCRCRKNYKGNTCNVYDSPSLQEDCELCKTSCPLESQFENECKCVEQSNYSFGEISGDKLVGFTTSLYLPPSFSNWDKSKLKIYVREQLLHNLRHDVPNVEDITITSISQTASGIDVTFRILGPKDDKRVRAVLSKWRNQGFFGNITISNKNKSIFPRSALELQSLTINQAGVIRQNDEFILSCVAHGPPIINFRWFKNGIIINTSSTKNRKWTKIIKDPYIADQYTAILAVTSAHPMDSGTFQCEADIGDGWKQCASIDVRVGRPPELKIEPLTATVRKGDNFSIKCLNVDENRLGSKYIYSWTKNKELLPVKTENERYEILYPSGTILLVTHAEKDVIYSCLVQDGITATATYERSVSVKVLGTQSSVRTCQPSAGHNGVPWPDTAPDTESLLACPDGYSGTARRYCSQWDSSKPKWEKPNYSGCMHSQLEALFYKFQQYQLGYMATSPDAILSGYLEYLNGSGSQKLLPGEGAKVLTLTQHALDYLNRSEMTLDVSKNITHTVFSIIDNVLMIPYSIVKSTDTRILLEVIHSNFMIFMKSLLQEEGSPSFRISLKSVDMTILNLTSGRNHLDYFHIPNYFNHRSSSNNWISVQFSGTNKENPGAVLPKLVGGVIFKNLPRFLPPRSFLRIKDGSEMEYEIYSQIIVVSCQPTDMDIYPVTIDFKHDPDRTYHWSRDEMWSVKCGFADHTTFAYTWDIYSCYAETTSADKTRCICPKSGVHALLLTLVPPQALEDSENSHRYIVLVGCLFCMSCAVFTIMCLAISFWLIRSSCVLILKLQCSVSIFVISFFFALATLASPPQKYYMLFITCLETFFLLAASSHLSKLLIIFTELTPLSKPVTSIYTIVGIISGVPVITVFGSHLSYRTMDVKQESWWMLNGTLALNIFLCVLAVMVLLFTFIYIVIMKKLQNLRIVHENLKNAIDKRMSLLRRSGLIFIAVFALAISSIIYVNFPDQMWSIYQFTSFNVILGFILIFCYLVRAETPFQLMFTNISKLGTSDKFFGFDSTNSPLNFLTMQEAEVANESGPHTKQDLQLYAKCSIKSSSTPMSVKSQVPTSKNFKNCQYTSTIFCESQGGLASPERNERRIAQQALESYDNSPQTLQKYSNIAGVGGQSPDLLSNKVCAELDLVASSLKSSNKMHQEVLDLPKHVLPPLKELFVVEDTIVKVSESSSSGETQVREIVDSDQRTQPDGHEEEVVRENHTTANIPEITLAEESPTVYTVTSPTTEVVIPEGAHSTSSNKLDGMLDSITHDLDFLLNRCNEMDVAVHTATLRRVSKLPVKSVALKLSEESEQDVDLPGSVTIRTNF